jgi:hypothetical protein
MTTNDFIILANDAGSRGLRLCGSQGTVDVPAHVATDGGGQLAKIEGLARRKPPMKIQIANLPPMYVGDTAAFFGRPVENLNHDRQTGTPEMRVVLYQALTVYQQQYGKLTQPIRMGLALPNQFLSGEAAELNKNAARWVQAEHEWQADGENYKAVIADVKLTTQGSAALFDYLLDEHGDWLPSRKEQFRKEIGVISVGFDTVELTVVQNKAIFPRFTRGEKVGARRLLRLYDPNNHYALGELEPLLRTGALDVQEHLPVWAREVTGFIENVWGNQWRRFAAIVIVGGGAILLKDTLPQHFNGKAAIPETPTLAVARGLYKLMLNQFARKDK